MLVKNKYRYASTKALFRWLLNYGADGIIKYTRHERTLHDPWRTRINVREEKYNFPFLTLKTSDEREFMFGSGSQ